MKRLVWLSAVMLAVSPAWAGKITVQQLKDSLAAWHEAHKTDEEVAGELRQVELTEELTHSAMNGMARLVPGQMTTEQLFVLELRSAVLAPPAADVPGDPAPDAATQKAILDKAVAYVTTNYAQLPAVTADKQTRRFQDSAQKDNGSMGAKNNVSFAAQISPIHYAASDESQVTFRNGAEQFAPPKEKTTWGLNGMIALMGQGPVLNTVLGEAQAAGKIEWLRWETVNGQKAAVYSYSVDKKKSHYGMNYCCFPETSQAGAMSLRGTETAGGAGNYQTNDQWKNWKATVPYHGAIFVNPDTGVVVRLITVADLKGSDPVRVENQRIDYGEQKVGDKTLMVPVQTLIDTVEQPYPDSPTGRYIMRHTLFEEQYKDYEAAK